MERGLDKENIILEENIVLDAKPFILSVGFLRSNDNDSLSYDGIAIDKYTCETKNIIDNNIIRCYSIIDNSLSCRFKVDFSKKSIVALKSMVLGSDYHKPFLYGIKKCVKVIKEYIPKAEGKTLYIIDPWKMPDTEMSSNKIYERLRVENNEFAKNISDWEDRSGKERVVIDKSIYLLLEELKRHFDIYKFWGLYFISDFSVKEIVRTLKYFDREGWIGDVTGDVMGSIILYSGKREIAYEILGINKNKSVLSNSLFIDVKVPYAEKEIVFMIMPFSPEKFEWLGDEKDKDSLKSFISEKSKAKCVTVADDITPHNILNKIYSHLLACKFAIADIASLNPNVLYEIGMANSLGKPVILICSKEELAKIYPQKEKDDLFGKFLKSVFDLNHYTIIDYGSDEELRGKLSVSIEQTLRTL